MGRINYDDTIYILTGTIKDKKLNKYGKEIKK